MKVVSSADLVQKYEACWTPEQLESHLAAGEAIDRIVREAFQLAAKSVREKKPLTEVRSAAMDSEGVRSGGNYGGRRAGRRGQRRTRAIRTTGHRAETAVADSRRRFVAAGRLGENESGRQRLLRHHLGRLSRRESAGEVREEFLESCAKRGTKRSS